jgi:cellulose synthase/poly-beta-1,6-N-acetylglucosamine synthase-like glycosyltransferase
MGGWDPYNVTEDCDMGLRLATQGLRTVMLASTTYEEANSGARNWRRQRARWIKGYLQTYFVHLRQPRRYFKDGHPLHLFWLQTVGAGRALLPLFNVIPWLLVSIALVLHPYTDSIFAYIFPSSLLALGVITFIVGNAFFIYLHIYSCVKSERYHLLVLTPFMPLYWLMMSGAAYIAVKELIFSPHFWAKTRHGLHLRPAPATVLPLAKAHGEARTIQKEGPASLLRFRRHAQTAGQAPHPAPKPPDEDELEPIS